VTQRASTLEPRQREQWRSEPSMMRDWKPVLRVSRGHLLLLVTSETGDILKARLPPGHPRALLTLLEALSLWSASRSRLPFFCGRELGRVGSGLFGDDVIPAESQLVHFRTGRLGCRVRRLRGVADFRALRRGAL
jgi:hypothetical protein